MVDTQAVAPHSCYVDLDLYSADELRAYMYYLDVIARSYRHALQSNYFDIYRSMQGSRTLTPAGQEVFGRYDAIYNEIVFSKTAVQWLMNAIGCKLVEMDCFKVFGYYRIKDRPDLAELRTGDDQTSYTICVDREFLVDHPVNGKKPVRESREYLLFLTRGFAPNYESVRDFAEDAYRKYLDAKV